MTADLRCLCAWLALALAVLAVSCVAVPMDLYGPEWQALEAERDEAKRAVDEAGAGDDDGGWKYSALLPEREARGRKNWRSSPHKTLSFVDSSVKTFNSRFSLCSNHQVCKQAEKRTFNCRCPVYTFCVADGRQFDAKCRYSKVGLVFKQPEF